MNEFLIQNYLLFAICWFGALVLLLGCIIWIWSSSNFNKTKKNIAQHAAFSSKEEFSPALNSEKIFVNHFSPVTRANSPAMRGAIQPSQTNVSTPVFAHEASLHIVRAKSISSASHKTEIIIDQSESQGKPAEENVSQITETHLIDKDNHKVDLTTLSGEDLERTQLDLAQALFESGRVTFANSILKELLENATDPLLKMEAQQLLNNLSVKIT